MKPSASSSAFTESWNAATVQLAEIKWSARAVVQLMIIMAFRIIPVMTRLHHYCYDGRIPSILLTNCHFSHQFLCGFARLINAHMLIIDLLIQCNLISTGDKYIFYGISYNSCTFTQGQEGLAEAYNISKTISYCKIMSIFHSIKCFKVTNPKNWCKVSFSLLNNVTIKS